MCLMGASQGVFVVWTKKMFFSEIVCLVYLTKFLLTLRFFFRSYVSQIMTRPLTYCRKCGKVLLEQREIDTKQQATLNSILCGAWFHYKCEEIKTNDIPANDEIDWICTKCLLSLAA